MAAPPGYVATSLLPAAGGTIHAMHGGMSGGSGDFVGPSLLPAAGGTIHAMHGGSMGGDVTGPSLLPAASGTIHAMYGGSVALHEIILFGTPLTLPPATDAPWTKDQQRALALFGLEGLKRVHQRDILQALYDGTCNTHQPLALMTQCEPIRRIVYTLALELKGKIEQVNAANADRRAQEAAKELRKGANMRMQDAETVATDAAKMTAETATETSTAETATAETATETANAVIEELDPKIAVEIAATAIASLEAEEVKEEVKEEEGETEQTAETAETEQTTATEEAKETAVPLEAISPEDAVSIATAALAVMMEPILLGGDLLAVLQGALRRASFPSLRGLSLAEATEQLASHMPHWIHMMLEDVRAICACDDVSLSPPPPDAVEVLAEAAEKEWLQADPADVTAAAQYALFSFLAEHLKGVEFKEDLKGKDLKGEDLKGEDLKGEEGKEAVEAQIAYWEARIAHATITAESKALSISIQDARARQSQKKTQFMPVQANRAEDRREWQAYRDMNIQHIHNAAATISTKLLTEERPRIDKAMHPIPTAPSFHAHPALRDWIRAEHSRLQRIMLSDRGLLERQQAAHRAMERVDTELSYAGFASLISEFATVSEEPYQRELNKAQLQHKMLQFFHQRDDAFFEEYVKAAMDMYRADHRYAGILAAIVELFRLSSEAYPDAPLGFILPRPVGAYVDVWRAAREEMKSKSKGDKGDKGVEAMEGAEGASRSIQCDLMLARLRAEKGAYEAAQTRGATMARALESHQNQLRQGNAVNQLLRSNVHGMQAVMGDYLGYLQERKEAVEQMEKTYEGLKGADTPAEPAWLDGLQPLLEERLAASADAMDKTWVRMQLAESALSYEKVERALIEAVEEEWMPEWLTRAERTRAAMLRAAEGILAKRGAPLHEAYVAAQRDRVAAEADRAAAIAEVEAWKGAYAAMGLNAPAVEIPALFEGYEVKPLDPRSLAEYLKKRAKTEAAKTESEESEESESIAVSMIEMELQEEAEKIEKEQQEILQAIEFEEEKDTAELAALQKEVDAIEGVEDTTANAKDTRLSRLLIEAGVNVNALSVSQKGDLMRQQNAVAAGKMTVEDLKSWLATLRPAVELAVEPAVEPELPEESAVESEESAVELDLPEESAVEPEESAAESAMEPEEPIKPNSRRRNLPRSNATYSMNTEFDEGLKEINEALAPVAPVPAAAPAAPAPAVSKSAINQAIEETAAAKETAERNALIEEEMQRPAARPAPAMPPWVPRRPPQPPTRKTPSRQPPPSRRTIKNLKENLKAENLKAENLKAENRKAENLKAENRKAENRKQTQNAQLRAARIEMAGSHKKQVIGLINGLSKVGITPHTISQIQNASQRTQLEKRSDEVARMREALIEQYKELEQNPSVNAWKAYKTLLRDAEYELRELKLGFQSVKGGRIKRTRKAQRP